MKKLLQLTLASAILAACTVCSALNIPGADGSDGALHVTADMCTEGVYLINLAQAATKAWDAEPDTAGNGVYDPEKWAVVFKYSSVTIDEGCTVRFSNHPANPPVYWLVSGDVTINGELNLDGANGQDSFSSGTAVCAVPGPGGFAGGLSMTYDSQASLSYYGGGGYGPGGGVSQKYYNYTGVVGAGGSHASRGTSQSDKYNSVTSTTTSGPIYGEDSLVPLVGGSGGAGYNGEHESYTTLAGGGSGGAGGGAICIAAKGKVALAGSILARGGRGGGYTNNSSSFYFMGGCGSGGAVRIVAETVEGSGTIDVSSFGGTTTSLTKDVGTTIRYIENRSIGAPGRVRLDASLVTLCGGDFTAWTAKPSIGNVNTVTLWAEARIIPLTLGGAELPADPVYRADGCNECVSFATAGERELVFRTENIPVDANVIVKVTPRNSTDKFTGTSVPATVDAGGTYASATWRAMIPLNASRNAFQVLVATAPLYE